MQTPASRLEPLAVYPVCLLASSDLIINGIVTSFPDLRLEIHVNQLSVNSLTQSPHSSPSPPNETHLALIRSPLPIRIPIKHHLATPRIFNLHRRMAQSTLRAPLNIIAGGFLDQEGLAAPLVAVRVNALLDCEVHNGAGGDFGCYIIRPFSKNRWGEGKWDGRENQTYVSSRSWGSCSQWRRGRL
jgi:hypothetical protein